MGINSRAKGCKGERDVAKLLETWTGKKFARTPSSGGLQWKSSNSKGDIVCTEEGHYHPFCHEIKTYKDINFQHLLYLDKAEIIKFWNQCVGDAERANKCPMLWMRYNGLPKGFHFIIIPSELRKKVLYKYMYESDKLLIVPHLDVTIITTEVLFKVPYKKIRKIIKTLYKAK